MGCMEKAAAVSVFVGMIAVFAIIVTDFVVVTLGGQKRYVMHRAEQGPSAKV